MDDQRNETELRKDLADSRTKEADLRKQRLTLGEALQIVKRRIALLVERLKGFRP